jgi:hypothetical protein
MRLSSTILVRRAIDTMELGVPTGVRRCLTAKRSRAARACATSTNAHASDFRLITACVYVLISFTVRVKGLSVYHRDHRDHKTTARLSLSS